MHPQLRPLAGWRGLAALVSDRIYPMHPQLRPLAGWRTGLRTGRAGGDRCVSSGGTETAPLKNYR